MFYIKNEYNTISIFHDVSNLLNDISSRNSIVPNLTNIPPGISIRLIENKNILLAYKLMYF